MIEHFVSGSICYDIVGFLRSTEHAENRKYRLITKLTACNRNLILICDAHITGNKIDANRISGPIIIDQIHTAHVISRRLRLIINGRIKDRRFGPIAVKAEIRQ